MYGTAFTGARRTNELVLVQGAQAERVSAAARAQAALPGAVEIYYLPAAKGSSALNYAPRRQQAALRSNPLRAERGESSARREAMAEMRPPLSPTSNNVKRASETAASQPSKKQRLGDAQPADQERQVVLYGRPPPQQGYR